MAPKGFPPGFFFKKKSKMLGLEYYLDVPGSMVRINGFCNLLQDGVFVGGIAHLLTIDPNFQQDIQVNHHVTWGDNFVGQKNPAVVVLN